MPAHRWFLAAALLLAACSSPTVSSPTPPVPTDAGSCAMPCGTNCCGSDQVCNPQTGACSAACAPNCNRRSCGSDGCGGSCGTCGAGTKCEDASGTCIACAPQCSGKACGPDGCGGVCGTCPTDKTCNASGQCAACAPTCTDKECGDDTCGGSCGTCPGGSFCNGAGKCVCIPQCADKQCGDDGCGGRCGTCGAGTACDANGKCVACTRNCTGKACGDDGCGGSCGFCGAGTACDASGQCQACSPKCTGKSCGDDGCGGACGMCATGSTCDATGQCVCTPKCTGRACGPDGCGGSCGTCATGKSCSATGQCVCTPDCTNRQCGDDGCGGSCGMCGTGKTCSMTGQCGGCTPSCSGKVCGDNGCGGTCGTCSAGTCTNALGRCEICTPNTKRCGAGNGSIETCRPDGSGWDSASCVCDPATVTCKASFCTPGARQCKDAVTMQECNAQGTAFVDKDCRTLDAFSTDSAVCKVNDCYDPCAQAARDGSSNGCEFWAAITPQTQLDPAFKANTADGVQGTSVSDFALVVVNSGATAANVHVTRKLNGAEVAAPSSPAANSAGYVTVPAGANLVLKLPWQSPLGTDQKPWAYHVFTDAPVALYQYNPITFTKSVNGTATYSYTNDGALLLPTHALGKDYVVTALEHMTLKFAAPYCNSDADCPGAGNSCPTPVFGTCALPVTYAMPAFFSVVATQDNTTVTVKYSGSSLKGSTTALAAHARGDRATYTLNRFDVLQVESDQDASTPNCQTTDQTDVSSCDYASDLTGSIVSSDKPVALFGGADCSLRPFSKYACDHLEEQLPPYSQWGKTFVVGKSAPYKTSSGVDVSSPSPDYYRVVSACGTSGCPNGTRVLISPAPAAFVRTAPGVSCSNGACTLPAITASSGGPFIEFSASGDFTVTADQPVLMTQIFSGESANASSVEGDPSLVVVPPVEQWRTRYDGYAPGFTHNYLSLVTQSSSPSFQINGLNVTSTQFPGLKITAAGTNTLYRVPVATGTLVVTSSARFGITVYGYAEFSSYGTAGGFDVKTLNTTSPGQ